MSQNTPGPWKIFEPHQTGGWGLCVGSKTEIIARLTGRSQEAKRSRAHLIAAAPDLLKALHYAVKQVPELITVPGIRAAIAKAEGEPHADR